MNFEVQIISTVLTFRIFFKNLTLCTYKKILLLRVFHIFILCYTNKLQRNNPNYFFKVFGQYFLSTCMIYIYLYI